MGLAGIFGVLGVLSVWGVSIGAAVGRWLDLSGMCSLSGERCLAILQKRSYGE